MTEYGKHGKPRSRQRHHPAFGPTRIAYLRILDFPWRTANPRKRFTRRMRWRGGDCEPQNSLLPNRWRNHSTSLRRLFAGECNRERWSYSAAFWQVALPRPELRQPLRRSSCPGSCGTRTLVGMDNARRYWYGAKRYPFGCRFPLTWEGWLVDAIWIASFIGISPLLRPDSQHSVQGLGLSFVLIAVFMAIRSWKGEPRWHD